MKLKIISMFLLMGCSKNAFADIYDATYQKFSSLSNLWVQSPKLYKSSLESNLVEFSEAGVSIEEYWSLQSNIVKRAKLTHKESKIAFGVQNGK